MLPVTVQYFSWDDSMFCEKLQQSIFKLFKNRSYFFNYGDFDFSSKGYKTETDPNI